MCEVCEHCMLMHKLLLQVKYFCNEAFELLLYGRATDKYQARHQPFKGPNPMCCTTRTGHQHCVSPACFSKIEDLARPVVVTCAGFELVEYEACGLRTPQVQQFIQQACLAILNA